MMLSPATYIRFISKIVKADNGCWLWCGHTRQNGTIASSKHRYGQFWLNGRMVYVHRLAWEIWHERLLPDGAVVKHRCTNGICVRPSHLYAI